MAKKTLTPEEIAAKAAEKAKKAAEKAAAKAAVVVSTETVKTAEVKPENNAAEEKENKEVAEEVVEHVDAPLFPAVFSVKNATGMKVSLPFMVDSLKTGKTENVLINCEDDFDRFVSICSQLEHLSQGNGKITITRI